MKIKNLKLKVKSSLKKLFTLHSLARRGGSLFTCKRGVTLIELVIVMVLAAIVAVVVANALSTGIKGNLLTDYRKEALDQARVAMERMRREIRNLDNKAVAPVISSSTQFCFTDTEGTLINYSLQGTNITREATGDCNAGGPNESTLATNITAPNLFQYFQADGVTPDSPFAAATTKLIRITLTATISTESVTLQTEVWPRNL